MHLSPNFMIGCLATETAAIESSFENPQIRLCHWHMLRALQKQANSKIKTSGSIEEQSSTQIKRSAVQDFLGLMHTETIKEFGQVWIDYFSKYHQHEEWLRYLNENWLKHPEKWWGGNRAGMLEINTNNYIESWHNTLKSGYLGGSRKQRTDILVYILLREVLPDFRLKIARVTMGHERRRLSNAEKAQRQKCTEFSSETASSLVRHSVVESGDDEYSKVILVKSFTNHDLEYVVSLNPTSSISYCSCAYMTESKSVCKHMFLARVVFGYSILYDTRLSENSNFCGKTPLVSNAESSTSRNDAIPESDDLIEATFREQVEFANSYVSTSSGLDDEERELLKATSAQLARLKRHRESKDRSWSKRQRQ